MSAIVGICITEAYEVVSCAQMYAVRCCECQMNNEQPKVVDWFSLCDVSCGQVCTVGICITKAYEVVSCAQMYAVRGCERQMNNEQPKAVGAGTSVNKEY